MSSLSKNKLNPHIPTGLQEEDDKVYEKIFEYLKDSKEPIPKVVVISDIQKDVDDLVAWTMLAEMHRLGVIELRGFVTNFVHANRRVRAGRGALDLLNLKHIPIAQGTEGTDDVKDLTRQIRDYEFDNCTFMAEEKEDRPEAGFELLKKLCTQVKHDNEKLTVLAISSHRDLRQFMEREGELVASAVDKVVSQGGFYELENDKVRPRCDGANIKFDREAAKNVYAFCVEHNIPLRGFTKDATFVTHIPSTFCKNLEEDGSVIGKYIHYAQVEMDKVFYDESFDPKKKFAEFMDPGWILKNKTSWPRKIEYPYPPVEEVIPYFTKLLAYDALAAIGAGGDAFMDALGVRYKENPAVFESARITRTFELIKWTEEVVGEQIDPKDAKKKIKITEKFEMYVGQCNFDDLPTDIANPDHAFVKTKDGVVHRWQEEHLVNGKFEISKCSKIISHTDLSLESNGDISYHWQTRTLELVNKSQVIGKAIVGPRTHQNYQAPIQTGQKRIDGDKMAIAIRALTRGSLLATMPR
ncbi:Nucleoside hydrolase [Glarea lozoyensis ATCC 20868]|uniref:Nucleoside hydrolase n=1 Tax=Glarea lozoyensis (strain ATCC 20868 / MF5171) TaxID=1116229 RepID=S3CH38_GLAL2|nr:Nucleoside hydrolase [Glarea lozoyensis ATCC 20868]EPE25185.1 Nucleoside hydrolase [Glarea lozoyensis ATCC 20868]